MWKPTRRIDYESRWQGIGGTFDPDEDENDHEHDEPRRTRTTWSAGR